MSVVVVGSRARADDLRRAGDTRRAIVVRSASDADLKLMGLSEPVSLDPDLPLNAPSSAVTRAEELAVGCNMAAGLHTRG